MPVIGSGIRSTSQKNRLNWEYRDKGTGLSFQMRPDMQVAPEVNKDLKSLSDGNPIPDGFAVISLGYGSEQAGMYPHPVTVANDTWWIPRGSLRAVPYAHMHVLLDAVETRLIQPRAGAEGMEYEANRFNVQVVKEPKGSGSTTKEKLSKLNERESLKRIPVV